MDNPRIINATGLELSEIGPGLHEAAGTQGGALDRVVAQLTRHVSAAQQRSRYGGILQRDHYLTPDTPFGQMQLARESLLDDVVGGAADASEFLAISEISLFAPDLDEQAIWDEWARHVDLGSMLRSAWRTLFVDSQFVMSSWWEPLALYVNDQPVNIIAPSRLTLIDTTRVVPVGMLMFGQELLAYSASPEEARRFDQILGGRDAERFSSGPGLDFQGAGDPIVERLIAGRYNPDSAERVLLANDGVKNVDNLFILDPKYTFRHTLTRSAGQRFSDVRLASVFELLDLKSGLHQSDRSSLIGSANYILLITQGTDENPITPIEYQALLNGAEKVGQRPYLVGDHRLKVEILTPKTDNTLDEKRYDNLDTRIFTRVYQTFVHGAQNRSSDDSKTAALVAKGLEGRRDQMRRTFEARMFDAIRAANPKTFTHRAQLQYHPSNIAVSFDAARATLVWDARMAGEVSRETSLNELGFRQQDEAVRLSREADLYDPIFKTQDPHGVPNPSNEDYTNGAEKRSEQRRQGRTQGGNRNGGGAGTPGDGHGLPPRRVDELNDLLRDDLIAVAGQYAVPGRHQMRRETLINSIRAARDEEELNE